MASLKTKVKDSLDEARILILGCHVLVGFEYRATFEPGFEKLPPLSQDLKATALALQLVALGLLMWPAAYHQIAEGGEDNDRLRRFATGVVGLALLPFAVGLGLDLFIAGERVAGRAIGVAVGAVGALAALLLWYGIELWKRPEARGELLPAPSEDHGEEQRSMAKSQSAEGTKLEDKISHALTEVRVVLPGAQALLGFQLSIILMESFEKLARPLQYVHLACLRLMALAMILLMAPAAYHRLVEQGEDTERMHRFTSRIILTAMVPLALGVSGDFLIVVEKVTKSTTLAATAAAILLILFYGLWFGYSLARRRTESPARRPAAGSLSASRP